ncbi:MAG: hypothetical protein FWC19_07160 [Treponema sp.]|jgi:hypothetical protein|nr:hypothetical protein [Treponema sp.]MCL2272560.1 hypothetical protein [Treponema sp.]
MSSSGKGGSNRKNKHRFQGRKDDAQKYEKPLNESLFPELRQDKNRIALHERPRWTAPILPSNPVTTPDCPWCGKQITDITTAITDKETGLPVHFDCVLERIAGMENLETNDSVCYIGGGRFGIIHYNNPPDTRDFIIKKIYEWEVKDANIEWRKPFSEYFSIT